MKEYGVPWDQVDQVPAALIDQLMMAEAAEAAALDKLRTSK